METGAEVGPPPTTAAGLAAFTSLPNDPTGIDTFERYQWQTKLAVLSWLASLALNGPVAIVAEMVEDLVIVETHLFRFAQLKTRDRGSWSAATICAKDHAISRLVESYGAAKDAGLINLSQFEVWLEGPPAEDHKTKTFFTNPVAAHPDIKSKIRAMGLRGEALTDFLSRLRVTCHQPSRQSVDAIVMKAIGAIWSHMMYQQVADLYQQLLEVATAAQAASERPPVVRAAIAAGRLNPADLARWEPIQSQVMLREQLIALCPPLNSATNEELAERAAAGETTLLELKLVRAGAAPTTVAKAINARADAEVRATLALSGGVVDAADVETLDERILSMADSVAALGRLGGPSAQAPAEHVFHTLMARPGDVSSTDVAGVFNGDPRLVIGHLCRLSDQCRFGWGRS